MNRTKIIAWIAALAAVAAIGYYFGFIYERADYQHPMVRTGVR
jgi:hypothetical protein